MPDPLTFLSASVAASHLVEQGLAIARFLYVTIGAMKDAPELVRIRLEQIRQLVSISQLIIQHPSFQTQSIEVILRTCLRDLGKLHDVLLRFSVPDDAGRLQRWAATFLVVIKGEAIEKAFSNLDREKTTLVVCMETINS